MSTINQNDMERDIEKIYESNVRMGYVNMLLNKLQNAENFDMWTEW